MGPMIALGVAARWLHLAAGLGLVGLVTATLLAGHSDRPTALAWEARMLRWARGLVGLVLLTGLVTLAHQSAVVTGRAGAALQIGEWVRLLGHSQFGTVWLVRHAALLLLAALLLFREREESTADRLALRGEAWLLAGIGVGATRRLSAVKWGVAQRIVWAWVLTIPLSAMVAAVSATSAAGESFA